MNKYKTHKKHINTLKNDKMETEHFNPRTTEFVVVVLVLWLLSPSEEGNVKGFDFEIQKTFPLKLEVKAS